MNTLAHSATDLARITAQCVKCGLCLPHCPTYALYNNESESPRGRIAIAEGLLSGQLNLAGAAAEHLNHCLQCGACERACPSKVPFVQLIDALRNDTSPKLAKIAGEHPRWLASAAKLGQWLPGQSLYGSLNRALGPLVDAPKPGTYNANGKAGRVSLFLGCLTRSHQGRVLQDALRLLIALGYQVDIPASQTCCGALAQHQGDAATAAEQMASNAAAFDSAQPVLALATACSAQQIHSGLPSAQDLYGFLMAADWSAVSLQALASTAALWTPCSQHALPGSEQQTIALLERIPQLKLQPMDSAFGCCGAGGAQLLNEREQAEQLRQPLLDALNSTEQAPEFLVSSNIGCSLHLAEGLKSQNSPVQVIHPISLLAQQLG